MSIPTLISDAQARPELFRWNGCVAPTALRAWLDNNQWLGPWPSDILAFWQDTGGGEIFETETVLGPLSDPALGDDIAAANREMRARGMSPRLAVYHIGLVTSAVDTAVGDYVELDPLSFEVRRRFATLDEWYRQTLRAEYGERYGLQ